MRGIRSGRDQNRRGRRIIPALAGNICALPRRVSPTRDHPRSRGEYRIAFNAYADQWGSSRSRGEYRPSHRRPVASRGSSPLSRGIPDTDSIHVIGDGIIPALAGIHYRDSWVLKCSGIIPALAGNTPGSGSFSPSTTDHPSSRGEYGAGENVNMIGNGSSLLSRGILCTAVERVF